MTSAQTSFLPPETEAQVQRRVHREMVRRDPAEFERMFRKARELSHDPTNGLLHHSARHTVTAEDVRRELGIERIPKGEAKWRGSNNLLGPVFKCKGWAFIGRINSTTDGRHGTEVKVWAREEHAEIARADWAAREARERAA